MACLTADQMKAAPPLEREKVKMPEWGEGKWIYVREMTVKELKDIRKVYFTMNAQGDHVRNARPGADENMIQICAVDESGQALCGTWNDEARATIGNYPTKVMLRVIAAINKLNDLGGDDDESKAGNP